MDDAREQAVQLLAAIRSAGCEPKLDGKWIAFNPRPPMDLLLQVDGRVKDEMIKLLKDGA